MLSNQLTKTELSVLLFIAALIAPGFVLVYTNKPLFEAYVSEDAFVEWITVLGLLMAAFTCFLRAVLLRKHRSIFFIVFTVILGLVLFFGAGEEISWGQRLLGIESPDYFKEKNTQGETNFHNLVLGGLKINMWIFSFLMTGVLALYIILIPLFYRTKTWMKNLVRYWGIPLPKTVHIVAFIMLFAITQLIPHGKRAELLEAGTALMLFLIISYPANPQSFVKHKD